MVSVSDDMAERASPLEYWFIKLHAGELAFLVDYIVRRSAGRAEVRVSLWVRGQGRVARTHSSSWRTGGGVVVVGESEFAASRSVGAVEDIEWELTYDCGSGRAAPVVPLLSRAHPFDLELISRPAALFDGHVAVAGERFGLATARGSVTHYWGRRLPDRWHWISANSFGDTDLILEAGLLRSRFWGSRPSMNIGYLWMREAGREHTLISPLNGVISVTGAEDDYTLVARRPGNVTRLHCSAPPDRYNDLGEGIRQTLNGSCVLLGRDLADSQAGLEYRRVGQVGV